MSDPISADELRALVTEAVQAAMKQGSGDDIREAARSLLRSVDSLGAYEINDLRNAAYPLTAPDSPDSYSIANAARIAAGVVGRVRALAAAVERFERAVR